MICTRRANYAAAQKMNSAKNLYCSTRQTLHVHRPTGSNQAAGVAFLIVECLLFQEVMPVKSSEELQSMIDDVLFAHLMALVAEAEGARLIKENQRLQNDPSAAVPKELDQKCIETIQSAFQYLSG